MEEPQYKQIPDSIRGYIAGLFDGEGYVQGISGWSIRIAMSDLEPLQVCLRAYGGTLNGPYKDKRGNRKDFWVWGLYTYSSVSKFYTDLGGFLCPRRQGQFNKALSNLPVEYPTSPSCGFGSIKSYARHKKRHEPPCLDCKEAWNIYQYNRNHGLPYRLRSGAK